MRDKLIELVLDYCTAPGKYASLGDERRFPYKTTELKKYSNEYLLELLEDFLEYKSLDITAVDNTYSEDVGNAVSDDILFGGEGGDPLYGHMELDPLFPVDSHYSDWDGGDSPIENYKKVK